MRPEYPPGRSRESYKNLSVLPQRGPLGPFGVFRRPIMTKAAAQQPIPPTPSSSSCSATTKIRSRGRLGFKPPMPIWSPRPPSSWTSRSMKRPQRNWPSLPRNCRLVGSTPTARVLCLTSGKTSTARSSSNSPPSLRPPSAKTTTTCRWRLACPGPGTRSRLATSSSPRKLWNTAGGKLSLSFATVTCSSEKTKCRDDCTPPFFTSVRTTRFIWLRQKLLALGHNVFPLFSSGDYPEV
jgi:hypothetical protein